MTNAMLGLFLALYLIDRYQILFNNTLNLLFFLFDIINPYRVGTTIQKDPKMFLDYDIEDISDVYEVTAKHNFHYQIKIVNPAKNKNGTLRYYPKTLSRFEAKQYYRITDLSKFKKDFQNLLK